MHGEGKGHVFLRRLECIKALFYVMDAAGMEGCDPIKHLEIMADESMTDDHELMTDGDGDLVRRQQIESTARNRGMQDFISAGIDSKGYGEYRCMEMMY